MDLLGKELALFRGADDFFKRFSQKPEKVAKSSKKTYLLDRYKKAERYVTEDYSYVCINYIVKIP